MSSWLSRGAPMVIASLVALGGCSKYDGPAEVARARSSGIPASAKIVSGSDTASRKNNLHYVRFVLDVKPDGDRAPFVLTSETLMDPFDIPRRQPGTTVRIRYLEDNHSFFAFDDDPSKSP